MTLDERALEKAARAMIESTTGPFEFLDETGQDAARFEARAAISAYLTAAGDDWEPIETAPHINGNRLLLWVEPVEEVVARSPDGNCVVIGEYVRWSEGMRGRGFKDGWSWYGAAQCKPTHWRPLPAAPKRIPAPEAQP